MGTQFFDHEDRVAIRHEAAEHCNDHRSEARLIAAQEAREFYAEQQRQLRTDGLRRSFLSRDQREARTPDPGGRIMRNADGSEVVMLPKSPEQIAAESAAAIAAQLRIQNGPGR